MSQEKVEIVWRGYEVINSIGSEAELIDPAEVAPDLWTRLAPDVGLRERHDLPDAKVYRGPEEVKEFWRKTQGFREVRREFREVRWEPLQFIELGHAVVVTTTITVVGPGSVARAELAETNVFWFRDDIIVRIQGFATKEEALEAARLRE